jgi:WD40 repeat protein
LVKLNTGQGFNPSVAFSPDGKLLVTHTSYDGKIKLWSMPKVELFKELSGHYSGVSDLRISPDGSRLISIDLHNVVRVWSLPGGKLLQTLDNFPGTVQKIALSSDAARLAIMIEDDKSVHLWSIPDDKSLATLDGKWSMTFSPDGALLAMPVDTKVHLYSAVDGVLINTLEGHDDSITRCSFTPDGSLLITGSFGGGGAAKEDHHSTIKFWSMPDGKLKKTLKSKKEKDTILSASPDGEWLATEYFKTPNTFTRFWSLPNGRRKKDFQLGESGCLTFSPDGSLLIQGQKELIRLYSWPDGILLNCLLDLESMSADSEGIEYEADDEKGGTITRHLPCGSALPPGAVCTCNCVSGGGCSCVGHSSGGSSHYWHPN